jgi:dipeptidase
MCDTLVAPLDSTASRSMLFGKNSDRQRNEPQVVERLAAATHPSGAEVDCTYIAIPQVPRTHAVLLCRPFWMWGAEMGANEHGVAIGNEALFARGPDPQAKALLGMDLVRLALERGATAAEAVEIITTLLERYGQGGNCGYLAPAYYSNGFIVADAHEAFVLESVGREWMLERVSGVRAVSNSYSIGSDMVQASVGLGRLLDECGWTVGSGMSYAEAIAHPDEDRTGNATERCARSTSLLRARAGQLGVTHMMSILRDHGPEDSADPQWQPGDAVERTVCMHATSAPHSGQTVGSLVSELGSDGAVHWTTATTSPCISIFKPVLIDVPLPAHGPRPTDRFDPRTLWWRHERLHRAVVLRDFARFIREIGAERDALEMSFRSRVAAVLNSGDAIQRTRVVAQCWQEALDTENRWHARIAGAHCFGGSEYRLAWEEMNWLARMDFGPLAR